MWTNSGPEGGKVRALVADPMDPSTLYAGTDLGGVFKSSDGGASWSAVSSGWAPGATVFALAVDPMTSGTVYAGTDRDGIFKSIDGGQTWTAIDSGLTDLRLPCPHFFATSGSTF